LLACHQTTIMPHFQSDEYFTIPTDSLTHDKKFLDLPLYMGAILNSQHFSGSYASSLDTFKQILHQSQITRQPTFDLRDESPFSIRIAIISICEAPRSRTRAKVLGTDQRNQSIGGVRAESGDRDFRSSFMPEYLGP
jgi:hypothetical protein